MADNPADGAGDPRDPLAAPRAAMDRVNARLADLLHERARLALDIARQKRALGAAIPDPARERAMLDAVRARAGDGFDGAELEALFTCVFRTTRAMLARRLGAG